MLYQTEGIFLAQFDLGEHDRVATVLTRDEGLVKAVVKGARKPQSKLSAVTQPYSKATIEVFRGRTFDRITQVGASRSYAGIMLDYDKMVYAGFLTELITSLLPLREPNPAAFEFTDAVLTALEERKDPWPVAIWGAIGILARTGFAPTFGACALCGSQPTAPLFFSPTAGGVICSKCKGRSALGDEMTEVSLGAARTLSLISESDGFGPSVTARGVVRREATAALTSYISSILGKRLNSVSLVERIEV